MVPLGCNSACANELDLWPRCSPPGGVVLRRLCDQFPRTPDSSDPQPSLCCSGPDVAQTGPGLRCLLPARAPELTGYRRPWPPQRAGRWSPEGRPSSLPPRWGRAWVAGGLGRGGAGPRPLPASLTGRNWAICDLACFPEPERKPGSAAGAPRICLQARALGAGVAASGAAQALGLEGPCVPHLAVTFPGVSGELSKLLLLGEFPSTGRALGFSWLECGVLGGVLAAACCAADAASADRGFQPPHLPQEAPAGAHAGRVPGPAPPPGSSLPAGVGSLWFPRPTPHPRSQGLCAASRCDVQPSPRSGWCSLGSCPSPPGTGPERPATGPGGLGPGGSGSGKGVRFLPRSPSQEAG